MPGEIIVAVAGGALRFIGRLLVEGLLELLVKGVGYLICRPFKRNVDPDGALVIVVGLAFWLAVGGVGYAAYRQLQGAGALDPPGAILSSVRALEEREPLSSPGQRR